VAFSRELFLSDNQVRKRLAENIESH
jgi:hypothetical protein